MTRISNLEILLSSNDKNRSIIELDNFIGELCNYGDEMNELTESQKYFFYNQNLEREINNGGINQYFINSSGNYAHQTIQSLQAINATITADILQKAIDLFPNKNVPQDQEERIASVKKIEEDANEIWEELDKKFFEYADDLNSLNLDYIRKNKTEF